MPTKTHPVRLRTPTPAPRPVATNAAEAWAGFQSFAKDYAKPENTLESLLEKGLVHIESVAGFIARKGTGPQLKHASDAISFAGQARRGIASGDAAAAAYYSMEAGISYRAAVAAPWEAAATASRGQNSFSKAIEERKKVVAAALVAWDAGGKNGTRSRIQFVETRCQESGVIGFKSANGLSVFIRQHALAKKK